MRKSIFILLFALLNILSAQAYNFEVNGICYNRISGTNDQVAVAYKDNPNSEGRGYTGSVVIPSTVTYNETTYTVTSIENMAFYYCDGLTSVTIPNSVTSIGNEAFEDCSGLTSVTIPESVTTIGWDAFSGCISLTSVTIPESVTSIGEYAFYGTSISSPLYNSKIFAYMPQSYKGDYTIPSDIQSIVSGAFSGCSGLTSITIPESVDSIGWDAFYDCIGLTSVAIPASVRSIGEDAFCGCNGLTLVEWNAVACYDFDYDDNYYISGPPFCGCENITSIIFGSQVEHIPAYLCYGMNKLRSLKIPASVTSIGGNAFSGCDGLISVTSLAKLPPYCEEENVFGSASEYYQTLYVSRGCKSAYESAREWHKFSKIEEFEANSYTVTVLPNDAAMGTVTGGGEYKEGEQATLVAIPNKGYYFDRWDDGNTDNPRILTVSGDTTIMAIFAKNGDNPTDNENPEADNFRVYVQGRTIHLSEDRGAVQVYNMAGQCVYNGTATAIPVSQSGVYIVAVGSQRFKVLVR